MDEFSEAIVSAPVVVLTGAGASVPLGKPTTLEFVRSVEAGLLPEDGQIWHWLMASCREVWSTETVDVEMILEHVRAVLDGTDMALRDYNLRPVLQDVEPVRDQYRRIERRICELVVDEYSDVDAAAARALYEPLLAEIRAQPGVRTLPIFTLNYDVALERAARGLRVRLVDGIRRGGPVDSQWSRAEFDGYRARGRFAVVLFKLHGSTTWAWADDDSLVELPVGTGKDPGALRHALLYPYLTQKDLESEPFRTGYGYLGACLAQARWLLIIGTSLRDQRLLETVQATLVHNSRLSVLLLDPSLDGDGLRKILRLRGRTMGYVKAGFTAETGGLLARQMAPPLSLAGPHPPPYLGPAVTSPAAAGP